MREIKFRAWDKQYNNMNYKILIGNVHDTDERYTAHCMWIKPENVDYKCEPHWCHFDEWSNIEIMQYTGLKDKNGLTEIYEGDIIDENGLVKGNIYETSEMDKRETDTIIQGFGTKTWCETVSRAILLGCRYSE